MADELNRYCGERMDKQLHPTVLFVYSDLHYTCPNYTIRFANLCKVVSVAHLTNMD